MKKKCIILIDGRPTYLENGFLFDYSSDGITIFPSKTIAKKVISNFKEICRKDNFFGIFSNQTEIIFIEEYEDN